MWQTKSLNFSLVLLTALLISGCSRSALEPVERIVTKTETQVIAVEPPRRPNQIGKTDFARFEVITQTNIEKILDDIEKGNKEPLNHVAIPYLDYLNMGVWMEKIEAYIKQAEEYFDTVDEEYKRVQDNKLEKKQ